MKSVIILLLSGIVGQGYSFSLNSCSSFDSCEDCVADNSCRWCPRDGECHYQHSAFNACREDESVVDNAQCNRVLNKYRPELSYKMVLLSAAAYDEYNPQECLNNAMQHSEFQILAASNVKCGSRKSDRCSGYVAVSDKEEAIVVAFRGSARHSQVWHELVSVLTRPKVSFHKELEGKVQRYWLDAYLGLWECMEDFVTAARESYPQYKIWVTGHSLGGTMASLASTQIVQDGIAPSELVVMYTFGMPRVGNSDYALDHDRLVKDSWRVVQYGDPIPHFPTLETPLVFGGPHHHGYEVYYRHGAIDQESSYKECHGKPFNEDVTCSFTDNPLNYEIEKHTIYFSIPVGSFSERRCLHEAEEDETLPANATFGSFEDLCTVYTF